MCGVLFGVIVLVCIETPTKMFIEELQLNASSRRCTVVRSEHPSVKDAVWNEVTSEIQSYGGDTNVVVFETVNDAEDAERKFAQIAAQTVLYGSDEFTFTWTDDATMIDVHLIEARQDQKRKVTFDLGSYDFFTQSLLGAAVMTISVGTVMITHGCYGDYCRRRRRR